MSKDFVSRKEGKKEEAIMLIKDCNINKKKQSTYEYFLNKVIVEESAKDVLKFKYLKLPQDVLDIALLFSGCKPMPDNKNIIKFLLNKGANPNKQDKEGNTKLHKMTCTKWYSDDNIIYKKMILKLIAHGANPYIKNIFGKNCFDLFQEYKVIESEESIYYEDLEIMKLHKILYNIPFVKLKRIYHLILNKILIFLNNIIN